MVDCLFIERADPRLESFLADAVTKDAGIDPATLAWLLKEAATQPLPRMTRPFEGADLARYRDALVERLRVLALPTP